jgi:hypothetical protein
MIYKQKKNKKTKKQKNKKETYQSVELHVGPTFPAIRVISFWRQKL